jgi:transcriptional regulator with XRE-family HTH domain
MEIGAKLRKLREAKNLSQGDIEKRTGLRRAYSSRVEHGHTVPTIETLEKYASALAVPLYRFFTDEESVAKQKFPRSDDSWGTRAKERDAFQAWRRRSQEWMRKTGSCWLAWQRVWRDAAGIGSLPQVPLCCVRCRPKSVGRLEGDDFSVANSSPASLVLRHLLVRLLQLSVKARLAHSTRCAAIALGEMVTAEWAIELRVGHPVAV